VIRVESNPWFKLAHDVAQTIAALAPLLIVWTKNRRR